jgi:hypothetical protein
LTKKSGHPPHGTIFEDDFLRGFSDSLSHKRCYPDLRFSCEKNFTEKTLKSRKKMDCPQFDMRQLNISHTDFSSF